MDLSNDWADKSIETNDTIAAQDTKYVKDFRNYGVSNPHPDYNKDPNIINEYGHTNYPKLVYPNGKKAPHVVVNSPEEEALIMGNKSQTELRDDGPTIAQFVAAGYKAEAYPPAGFKSKSTEEEIKAAIEAEASKSNGWG